MKQFILMSIFCFVTPQFSYATDIMVLGLFKGRAIVNIDGQRRTLKPGKPSPEGVTLISADSDVAILEVDGKQQEYKLGRHVGSRLKIKTMRKLK